MNIIYYYYSSRDIIIGRQSNKKLRSNHTNRYVAQKLLSSNRSKSKILIVYSYTLNLVVPALSHAINLMYQIRAASILFYSVGIKIQ